MGVESYHVSIKSYRHISLNEWKLMLFEKNFKVNVCYEFYNSKLLGIHKKRTNQNAILVDSIAVLNKIDDYNYYFSACFSCFDNSLNIISNIIKSCIDEIEIIYYGRNILSTKDVDKLEFWIKELQSERYNYFLNLFGGSNLEIPPYEFYSQYKRTKTK